MLTVWGPSELKPKLFGEFLYVIQVGEGDRQCAYCCSLFVGFDLGQDADFDVGDLLEAEPCHLYIY